MKTLKHLILLTIISFFLASCNSVRVTTDYDTQTDFTQFKRFAFYKKGIDMCKISDLDKKRILRAIEKELLAKGMVKSNEPDVLVSIFTKSEKKVDVFVDPWFPMYYGPFWGNNISRYTEGTLFIDLIDKNAKKLIWQGIGIGALNTSGKVEKKEERINEFVTEILNRFPPGNNKK